MCRVQRGPGAIIDRDPGLRGPTTLITTAPPKFPQGPDLPVQPQKPTIHITPLPRRDSGIGILKAKAESGMPSAPSGPRMVGTLEELVGEAARAAGRVVVVGESLGTVRVTDFAEAIGAEAYSPRYLPPGEREPANRQWIRDARESGALVIDVGPIREPPPR